MCDADEGKKNCGCDGDFGKGNKRKCACRGSESFERWKKEMLENGSCNGKSNNGKETSTRSRETLDCSCFKKDRKKKDEKCGCSCCGFFFCAAALIAVGVGAAWVKKKFID